jgi:hypothetical protein
MNGATSAFFRRGGAYIAFEVGDEFGLIGRGQTGTFTYRERESIPLEWSAIIGDVLHNLRSALDLIACDLHRITGGNPKEISGVYYPFCKDRTELPQMIRQRRLGHIGKEFRSIIEQTSPYKGGNDGLRAIHDLDILDKHQALVPTIAVVSIDWPVPIQNENQQFTTSISKNGQRLMMFPISFCPLPIGTRIKAEFSVVFGAVGVFIGRDVVKQLGACVASVEVILTLFKSVGAAQTTLPARGS